MKISVLLFASIKEYAGTNIISFDIEDDISYFARKKVMAPQLIKVTDEHYEKSVFNKLFRNNPKLN